MRPILLLLCIALTACANHVQSPETRVEQFYQFYLNAIVTDNLQSTAVKFQMREYIAQDTLTRLDIIQNIYEQEIIDSDYFTYGQDYAKEWIPGLNIGNAYNLMSGKVIDVWLGIQDGKKHHLITYLRMEDGKWKIYRIRSVTYHFEQSIFDDKAIASAKAYAASIK